MVALLCFEYEDMIGLQGGETGHPPLCAGIYVDISDVHRCFYDQISRGLSHQPLIAVNREKKLPTIHKSHLVFNFSNVKIVALGMLRVR